MATGISETLWKCDGPCRDGGHQPADAWSAPPEARSGTCLRWPTYSRARTNSVEPLPPSQKTDASLLTTSPTRDARAAPRRPGLTSSYGWLAVRGRFTKRWGQGRCALLRDPNTAFFRAGSPCRCITGVFIRARHGNVAKRHEFRDDGSRCPGRGSPGTRREFVNGPIVVR